METFKRASVDFIGIWCVEVAGVAGRRYYEESTGFEQGVSSPSDVV